MNIEDLILTASVVLSLLSLALTPRHKLLQMQFVFLFVQLPTWMLGLAVVQMGLIEYPHRELASVNRTSFIFEYIALPVLCVHVNTCYPWRAAAPLRAAYLAGIALLLTGAEVIFERYTQLIKYTGWEWYWTWLSVLLIFWLTQRMVEWFFKPIAPAEQGGESSDAK